MDVTTKELWDLTTSLFGAMELPLDSVNGSELYLRWYQDHFVDGERLSGSWTLLSQQESVGNVNNIKGLWAPYLTATLRTFLAGFFPQTANFVDSALRFLRANVVDCFTAEEESCIANVVRLLGVAPQSPADFMLWQRDASHCIGSARYVFQPSNESNDEPAQRLKALSLDLLLMMSGDMPLIREHCTKLELSALDFSAALIALVRPFSPLHSVHELLETTCAQWTVKRVWYTDIVVALIGCRDPLDFVSCMEKLHELSLRQASIETGFEEEADTRIFCLQYMALHIVDISIDAILLPVARTALHFVRNDLLASYVSMFSHHPALWRTAATYVAFAPLMNPAQVRDIILTAGGAALNDTKRQDSLDSFLRGYYDADSAFQRCMRSQLRAIVDGSKALEQWIEGFDVAVTEAVRLLRVKSIVTKWNRRRYAAAVWEAVESEITAPVQHRISQLLSEPFTADSLETLATVGEAVQCGHVALNRVRPSSFATLLHVLTSFTLVISQKATGHGKPQFVRQATPAARIEAIANIMDHSRGDSLHSSTVVQLCETVIDLAPSVSEDDSVQDALVKVNTALGRMMLPLEYAPSHFGMDAQRLRDLQKRIILLLATIPA